MTRTPKPASRHAVRILAGLLAVAVLSAPALAGPGPEVPDPDPLAVPTITSAPRALTNVALPVFTWTGSAGSYTWEMSDAAGAKVAGSSGPETSAAPAVPLADGSYAFAVWPTDPDAGRGEPARHAFTIDTVAPPTPVINIRPPFPTTQTTPTFGVGGLEAGAAATWRVVASGGVPRQGPTPLTGPTVVVAALAPGSYAFEVQQSDPAGNASAVASAPFAIVAPPAEAAATPDRTRLVLPQVHSKRLKPRVGARVASVQPVLKWTRGPKGTTLYNVQVFRVGARTAENAATVKLTKLRSVFPRTRQVRMRGLKRGQCYVWRVWPYVGSKFTAKPLGVSNFCVAAPRRAARP